MNRGMKIPGSELLAEMVAKHPVYIFHKVKQLGS